MKFSPHHGWIGRSTSSVLRNHKKPHKTQPKNREKAHVSRRLRRKMGRKFVCQPKERKSPHSEWCMPLHHHCPYNLAFLCIRGRKRNNRRDNRSKIKQWTHDGNQNTGHRRENRPKSSNKNTSRRNDRLGWLRRTEAVTCQGNDSLTAVAATTG